MSQPESTEPEPADSRSFVEVRIGATPMLISSVRAVAADIAMREDFDLDSIEDLKLAVDEVCSTLVRLAAPNTVLSCTFRPQAGRIGVETTVLSATDRPPRTDSFGWRVLVTLADSVAASVSPTDNGLNLVRVQLEKGSETAVNG